VPEIAYVNGEFLPLERAMVHVEDRGFQFADSAYEVMRTYNGKLFATEEHMARLFRSLSALELEHRFTAKELIGIAEEAVQRAGFAEAMVYLQVTRGVARRYRGVPARCAPTVVMTVRELHRPPPVQWEKGLFCITAPDNRWGRCDIKTVALLANVLAYHAAQKAGASDAIFIEADGTVAEATAGNIFIVSRGELRTPPKSPRLLSGITRDKLLEAARAAGIPCAEHTVTKTELLAADEVFLSSTTNEVAPVTVVDGQKIGTGKPGPVARRVYEQFLKIVVRS
jgi:D-alanine transaminase